MASGEKLDLVLEGYAAWNQGDRQWVLDHMSPDVEWVTPRDDPDPGTYRGHDGVLRFWEQWRAAVGQLHFEPQRTDQIGDHVVITAERSGVGEHSGLAVSDTITQVFTFEGDKCVRVHESYDRAEALRSIGAEELVE